MYRVLPVETIFKNLNGKKYFKNARSKNAIKCRYDAEYLSLSGIYAIYCISNKKYYIGSTKKFRKRLATHSNNLCLNKHENKHLQNAYNLYGADNFEFLIIELISKEMIEGKGRFVIENYYFDALNIKDYGFNIALNAEIPIYSIIARENHSIKLQQNNANKKLPYNQLLLKAREQFANINLDEVKIIQGSKSLYLVDADDFEKFKVFNWFNDKQGKAVRVGNILSNDRGKMYYLAKEILNTNEAVKFRNNNFQDCRKENILIETQFNKEKNIIKYINFYRNSYRIKILSGKSQINFSGIISLQKAIYYRDCFIKYYKINENIIDNNSIPLSLEEIKINIKKDKKCII